MLDASISVPKPHVKRDAAGKLLSGETLYAELEEFYDDPTTLVPADVRPTGSTTGLEPMSRPPRLCSPFRLNLLRASSLLSSVAWKRTPPSRLETWAASTRRR